MKKTLLYIHGYGSDRKSRKFQELKIYFGDNYHCYCLEWVVFSDIPYLLKLAKNKLENTEGLVIIGDSTGANLAYQLREMRKNESDKLILLSPLLDITKQKSDIKFPEDFERQLIRINNPENALVVASKNDEVIDQRALFEEPNEKFTFLAVEDGHRLEKFLLYLPELEKFMNGY